MAKKSGIAIGSHRARPTTPKPTDDAGDTPKTGDGAATEDEAVEEELSDATEADATEADGAEADGAEADGAEANGTELSVARSEATLNGRDFKNALIPKDFKYTGRPQVGLVLEYKSGGDLPGQLVVTDIPLGDGAMYITAPIKIKGESIVKLLTNKDVKFDTKPLKKPENFLKKSSAGLDAFYYGTDPAQPFILSVKFEFDGGLIDSLVNNDDEVPFLPDKPDNYETNSEAKKKWDEEKAAYDIWVEKGKVPVSQIFDLEAVSVRIVKVDPTKEDGKAVKRLEAYLNSLRRPVTDE